MKQFMFLPRLGIFALPFDKLRANKNIPAPFESHTLRRDRGILSLQKRERRNMKILFSCSLNEVSEKSLYRSWQLSSKLHLDFLKACGLRKSQRTPLWRFCSFLQNGKICSQGLRIPHVTLNRGGLSTTLGSPMFASVADPARGFLKPKNIAPRFESPT